MISSAPALRVNNCFKHMETLGENRPCFELTCGQFRGRMPWKAGDPHHWWLAAEPTHISTFPSKTYTINNTCAVSDQLAQPTHASGRNETGQDCLTLRRWSTADARETLLGKSLPRSCPSSCIMAKCTQCLERISTAARLLTHNLLLDTLEVRCPGRLVSGVTGHTKRAGP